MVANQGKRDPKTVLDHCDRGNVFNFSILCSSALWFTGMNECVRNVHFQCKSYPWERLRRGVFSPPQWGGIEIRRLFPPQNLDPWGGKSVLFPPHIPDPWRGKNLFPPHLGGEISSPQAKILSILTSKMLDFPYGNTFQKCKSISNPQNFSPAAG